MNKYNIKDLEKAIDYLKKQCNAIYIVLEIDPMGRLELKSSDIAGNRITIIIFNDDLQKMPEVTKTERL